MVGTGNSAPENSTLGMIQAASRSVAWRVVLVAAEVSSPSDKPPAPARTWVASSGT